MLRLSLALAAGASAIELTPENWDKEVAGKSLFVKFFAPWCGHCKKLKPDWDKLMEDFAESPTSLIADVDCTGGGKELCEKYGVSGYPALKYGSPDALEEYQGGRSYDELKTFADESLGPSCSPSNLELCSEEKRALIDKFQKMSDGKLDAKIRKAEGTLKKLEEEFEAMTKSLQERYEAGNKKKDEAKKQIKDAGLGLAKSVLAFRKEQGEKDEL